MSGGLVAGYSLTSISLPMLISTFIPIWTTFGPVSGLIALKYLKIFYYNDTITNLIKLFTIKQGFMGHDLALCPDVLH
jgi:hypothetical protein